MTAENSRMDGAPQPLGRSHTHAPAHLVQHIWVSWKWTTDKGSRIPGEGRGSEHGKSPRGQAFPDSVVSLAPSGRMDGQIASLVHNGLTPGIMGGEQPGWRLAGGAGQHCKLRTTSLAVGKGGRCMAVPSLRQCRWRLTSGGWRAWPLTGGPFGRCPRWPGRLRPCQGHSAYEVRPGSEGRSSAHPVETGGPSQS